MSREWVAVGTIPTEHELVAIFTIRHNAIGSLFSGTELSAPERRLSPLWTPFIFHRLDNTRLPVLGSGVEQMDTRSHDVV
jgi:hypothetical protein